MVYNPPKQSSSSNSLVEVQKSQAPAELEEEVGEVLLQPEMGSWFIEIDMIFDAMVSSWYSIVDSR